MPDYAFRSKPVQDWSAEDLNGFCKHLMEDRLPKPGFKAPAGPASRRGRVLNLFDSSSYAGEPRSPFEWHRDIKSRLSQAESVNQDLEMLRQCLAAGKLDGLSRAEKSGIFAGVAREMATIRYGYTAGVNPERAADYKDQMAFTIEYGGIDMVMRDVNDWRSGMQELLNSEYEKAARPDSRYMCRFFVRGNPSDNFVPSAGCVFYDMNLMDEYLKEYVGDCMADGVQSDNLCRFTTAQGDYDTRYRVTKTMAVAQGRRVMSKVDWVNNSKAQAAFSQMAGWGLSGDKYKLSQQDVKKACAANDGTAWMEDSKARVGRANVLYANLEALAELPLDKNGSLKFQPSFSMCAKCGWVPSDGDKKASPKDREMAFQKELFVRTADVLYGPEVAAKLQTDMKSLMSVQGPAKDELLAVWSELKSGNFDAVKDRVVEWSGERLSLIDDDMELISGGARPVYRGKALGSDCAVYSDAAAVACVKDAIGREVFGVGSKGDGLDLPVENMDLMYSVYQAGASVRGQAVQPYDKWSEVVKARPDLNLAYGDFPLSRDVPVSHSEPKPEPEPKPALKPEPSVKVKPGPKPESNPEPGVGRPVEVQAPAEFLRVTAHDIEATAAMHATSTDSDVEFSGFDAGSEDEAEIPAELFADVGGNPLLFVKRDMGDIDAAASEINGAAAVDMEYDSFKP